MSKNNYTNRDKVNALEVLAKNEGNVKATARELGISPNTIKYWNNNSKFIMTETSNEEVSKQIDQLVDMGENLDKTNFSGKAEVIVDKIQDVIINSLNNIATNNTPLEVPDLEKLDKIAKNYADKVHKVEPEVDTSNDRPIFEPGEIIEQMVKSTKENYEKFAERLKDVSSISEEINQKLEMEKNSKKE